MRLGGDRSERSEAGDTLIEILVALAIIGIAATGLLVGLTTTIASSGNHRNLSNLDAVLRSFSESARYQLQLQPNSGSVSAFPGFARCATNYTFLTTPIPASGPPGTQAVAFGTGFPGSAGGTVTVGTFTGTTAAPSLGLGGVTAPFTVPDQPAGPQTVTVTYGSTSATTNFTVTPFVYSVIPGSAAIGGTVTAVVKGFPAANTLKVKVGALSASAVSASTDANGDDSSLQFVVPVGAPAGANTVTVSDSTGTYTANATITVGPTGGGAVSSSPPASNLSGYQVGVTSIKYWNGSKFTGTCVTGTPAYEDLQQVTVSGKAPGAVDALSFVVSDPDANGAHPVTAPTVSYSGPANPHLGDTLTFNATLGGTSTGGPPIHGTVNWVIQNATGAAPTCTSTSGPTQVPSTNNSTASCTVTGPYVVAGTYSVTAVYSGDPYYSTNQGTGDSLVTVPQSTPTVTISSTGLTDGTLNLSALVSGPANAITPSESSGQWTISGPITSCTTTTGLGAGTVQGTATDGCSIQSAVAGTYGVTYSYGGDANYPAAQNSPPTNFQVATLVVSDAVTGTGPTETLTFTATLTTAGATPVPTGLVNWAISGGASACTAQVPLTPKSSTTYTAQCSILATNPATTYNATATFGSDANYVPATASDKGVTG